jgi:L-alanine-DL-glutamate epimerase-like enolase superfamily enzyme
MSPTSFSRRDALRGFGVLTAASLVAPLGSAEEPVRVPVSQAALQAIADQPVLDTSFLTAPVTVASIELLQSGRTWLMRARSKNGAEAVTVPHQAKMPLAYPLLLKHLIPPFIGADARAIEATQWQAWRKSSTYKMQGLLHGVAVMAVEQVLLELMGRVANRAVADFFGGAKRRDIPVYVASGNRGNTPAQEIEHLQRLVAQSGARALKFRLGARMSRNADEPTGRSEALIPLVRRTFGDAFTLYADANSSYDVTEGIRIGRLMEAHGYGFYEEPCEFDDLWGTKQVADTLTIPVALGEQEYSLHRWRWCIAERAGDIMQPDLHYGGGFIRATRVARMAAAVGMPLIPHMSGGGLGYLDLVQFAAFTPNIGPFMEFKGNTDIPVTSATSSLRCEGGMVRCPTGPGFGVEFAPELLAKAVVVKA